MLLSRSRSISSHFTHRSDSGGYLPAADSIKSWQSLSYISLDITTNSLDKLIWRVQADRMDASEIRAQLELYHRESYGWALSCCLRNPVDAESVLQTVYVKVLEGKARFDGKAAFKTWLFSVIRKTAADHRRHRMLHRFRLIRYEESNARIAREENPETAVYHSEIQKLFRRSLARLPARQRETLQLVFYHDLSLAEAAHVMGVSIGSARNHYERGKKRLRQLVAEPGTTDETQLDRRENQATIL